MATLVFTFNSTKAQITHYKQCSTNTLISKQTVIYMLTSVTFFLDFHRLDHLAYYDSDLLFQWQILRQFRDRGSAHCKAPTYTDVMHVYIHITIKLQT